MGRKKRPGASQLRKLYMVKFVGRCAVFLLCLLGFFLWPEELDILHGWNFFARPSALHLLWALWVVDMIFQLMPVREHIPLGSQKLFRQRFKPIRDKVNVERLKEYVRSTTAAAYRVLLLWIALIGALGVLYAFDIIDRKILFLVTVCFYVCDLICVLFWCPFRLMMRTRCCTTCRIFNWDHLMMFSPMLVAGGFYGLSLFALALAVWCLWELCVLLYPERFWEVSNEALQCSNCTDKLCTQYCQKLRKSTPKKEES